MVYAIAATSDQRPRWHQLEHVIRRNFGGLTERTPVDIFKRYFQDTDVSRGNFFFLKKKKKKKKTRFEVRDIFFPY